MSLRPSVNCVLALVIATALSASVAYAGEQVPNPFDDCESWGQLPPGRSWGFVVGVGVDHHGNIWVADRCGSTANEPCVHSDIDPIMEFDSKGKFLKSFGAGLFVAPHSLYVDKSDNVWVADTTAQDGKGNQVIEFSADGKVLLKLGTAGVYGVGSDAFSNVTDVVVAQDGSIFVADGHQFPPNTNTRVVKFSKEGKYVKQWGKPGTNAPGEFQEVHAIAINASGHVLVGDRANDRIQVFDQDGRFLHEWRQFGQPRGIFIDSHDTMYVTNEAVSHSGQHSAVARGIWIARAKDGVITGYVPPRGAQVADTTSQLRVATDSTGNMYLADFKLNLKKCLRKM